MNKINFPIWLWIIICFHILLEVILGAMILFDPSSSFPEIAEVAGFPIGLYAVRSIAVGIPMVIGLIKRDAKMLWVCFLIRLITDLLDLGLILVKGYPVPGIGQLSMPIAICLYAGLFYLPEILAMKKLRSYFDTSTRIN